jgi:hypothetical protein
MIRLHRCRNISDPELSSLLPPAWAFDVPKRSQGPRPYTEEKRAILSSWASDSCGPTRTLGRQREP